MSNTTLNMIMCPIETPWCTEHTEDCNQCVSLAIDVSKACCVWLVLEPEASEPHIVVDTSPSAPSLTLLEAIALSDALKQLRAAALEGIEVPQ